MANSKGLSMNRPSIKSYANRVWSSEKYHNFPTNMDKTIVSQGLYATHNGASAGITGTDTVLKAKLFGLKVRHFNNP